MKKVAVLGLGIMGSGIAFNFLKNGYKVVVWNRTSEKSHPLIKLGASLAATPEKAAEQADLIFEVTANDESSREVWLGKNGILAKPFNKQKYLITCATLSVKWTEELVKKSKQPNVDFFDMPVTGGRLGAETGQLILLVGGDEKQLKKIRSDLKAIAKDVKHFGPTGSGTKYKLILNALQAIHIVGLGEVVRLATKVGLNKQKTIEALRERPGGISTQIAAEALLKTPKQVSFSVDWITKDLLYANAMADKVDHKLLDDVIAAYKKIQLKGQGSEDWTKVNSS